VLGTYSRPDLEIELQDCRVTGVAAEALVEVLGRNQGPTKLMDCDIDNSVLAEGLRGNSSLKSLGPRISSNLEDGSRQILAIAGALAEKKGLVELDFRYNLMISDETWGAMSDETWGAICDSVKTHPTLEVLDLGPTDSSISVPASRVQVRIQAPVDMLKVNMSIHTIPLYFRYSEHELVRGSVLPYLETNRLRARVRAIQKTRSIGYRTKVVGLALLAVRTDPNHFWLLLSGNADVAFSSTAATTMLAANLPTPATAAEKGAADVAFSSTPATTMLTANVPTPATAAEKVAAFACFCWRFCKCCFRKQ
jgi:hypothetical protein